MGIKGLWHDRVIPYFSIIGLHRIYRDPKMICASYASRCVMRTIWFPPSETARNLENDSVFTENMILYDK